MHIQLRDRIELSETNSVSLRQQLKRNYHNNSHKENEFVQVIFDGQVDIEISFKIPICGLTSINADRLQSILLTSDLDSINDFLQDFDYLCTGTPYHIKMVQKGSNDPYSFLYGNITEYDIQCILEQCALFLEKQKSNYTTSYRMRFIQFLVYCEEARLPYMAKKLTKLTSHPNQSYLWYL